MASLMEQRKSRSNGLMLPLHPLQFVAWTIIILFTVFYFGVMIFHIPASWRMVAIVIPAVTFSIHIIVHVICLVLDPAEPNVRTKSVTSRMNLRLFNRNVQSHVIENNYCYICEVKVSSSAKHCSACNKCVSEFDHHCKWLNNCVGGRNYRLFLVCIFTALVSTAFIFGMSLYQFIAYFVDKQAIKGANFTIFGGVIPDIAYPIVIGILGLLALVASGLVGHLFFFHVYLISNGLTTYLYIIGERNKQREETDSTSSGDPKKTCCLQRKVKVSPDDLECGNGNDLNDSIHEDLDITKNKVNADHKLNGTSNRSRQSSPRWKQFNRQNVNGDTDANDEDSQKSIPIHLSRQDNSSGDIINDKKTSEKDYQTESDVYSTSDNKDTKPLLHKHNTEDKIRNTNHDRLKDQSNDRWNSDSNVLKSHERFGRQVEKSEEILRGSHNSYSTNDDRRITERPYSKGHTIHPGGESSSESLHEIPVSEIIANSDQLGTTYVDVENVMSPGLALQSKTLAERNHSPRNDTEETFQSKRRGRPLPPLSTKAGEDGRITPRSLHSSESQRRKSPRSPRSPRSRQHSPRVQSAESNGIIKKSTRSDATDEFPARKSRSPSSSTRASPRSRLSKESSSQSISPRPTSRKSGREISSAASSISNPVPSVNDRNISPSQSSGSPRRKKKRKPINSVSASDRTMLRSNSINKKSSTLRSAEALSRPGPLPSVKVKGGRAIRALPQNQLQE